MSAVAAGVAAGLSVLLVEAGAAVVVLAVRSKR